MSNVPVPVPKYVKMPFDIFMAALENAALEGIVVGKANTAGDYTESGIAFHAWNDHRSEITYLDKEND